MNLKTFVAWGNVDNYLKFTDEMLRKWARWIFFLQIGVFGWLFWRAAGLPEHWQRLVLGLQYGVLKAYRDHVDAVREVPFWAPGQGIINAPVGLIVERLQPTGEHLAAAAIGALTASFFVWILLPSLWVFFAWLAKVQGQPRWIKGAQIITPLALRRLQIRPAWLGLKTDWTSLALSPIRVPIESEPKSAIVIGAQGGGKSESVLFPVVEQAAARKNKILAYDYKGDYMRFFDPKNPNHYLFNPLDVRSNVRWDIMSEVETEMDIISISQALIPPSNTAGGAEKFFNDAGRAVFAGWLAHLYQTPETRNNEALERLLVASPEEKVEALKTTTIGQHALPFVPDPRSKQTDGVFATIAQWTMPFRYLSGSGVGKPPFSFRRWVRDEHPEGSVLIVANYSELEDTLKGILSLAIALVVRQACGRENRPQWQIPGRIFVVLDEFATLSLNDPKWIVRSLEQARSRSVSLWLGVQSLSSIETLYGDKGVQSIMSSCGSKFIFRSMDKTAETISHLTIGQSVTEIQRLSRTQGNDNRDGVALSSEIKTDWAVLPSDLAALKVGEAYVGLPSYPWTRVRFRRRRWQTGVEPTFICRPDVQIAALCAEREALNKTIQDAAAGEAAAETATQAAAGIAVPATPSCIEADDLSGLPGVDAGWGEGDSKAAERAQRDEIEHSF